MAIPKLLIPDQEGPLFLYGVMQYRTRSNDGSVGMERYLLNEQKGSFGFMADRHEVLYFRDEGRRDEFARNFGGLKCTLTRKRSTIVKGLDALKAVR